MKPFIISTLALSWGCAISWGDLIAYYPFDSDFADASGNGNDLVTGAGTPTITTTAGERIYGTGALDIDSTTADQEYLNLTTSFDFAAGDPWSVVFWARHRPGTDGRTGMIVGDLTSADFIWIPSDGVVNGGLRLRNSNSVNADYASVAGASATGVYNHWAVVGDGAGNVEVWLNNSSLGKVSIGTGFEITSVGQAFNGIAQSMNGQIDELYIYDEVIDAPKVEELFLRNDAPPPPPPPDPDRVRVFLLGGQSNAVGQGDPSGLPTSPVNLQLPQDDVDFYSGSSGPLTTLKPASTFGPEITMGRHLADWTADGGSTRVAILKYASGGTDLKNEWKPGGDATTSGDGTEFVTFQTTVTNGLAALASTYPNAEIEIEGMLWVQGERDARLGYQDEYEANLTAFIAEVRLTYGAGLPFVVMRLSSGQTNLPAVGLAGVRDAQTAVAAADPQTELIDSDSFGLLSDNLHFDASGVQEIGDEGAVLLASHFPFSSLSISVLANGDIEIRVADEIAGFDYTLLTSDSLLAGSWAFEESKTATDSPVVFTYTPDAGDPCRFFEVSRSPGS